MQKQPGYLRCNPKNLVHVIIDGKAIYLGNYNSPESWEKYHRILAEWSVSNAAVIVICRVRRVRAPIDVKRRSC